MSKLSTSDIIARGEYLEPDFNPASLTIPHLLGILGYHGVNYPSQHSKAKLVQLFNDEIKAHSERFKKERLSRQNSQASDEGIKDGITGEALNGGRKAPRTRAASRRASSQLSDAPGPAPPRLDPVKRRRSTAEPELGPPRRRRVAKPVEEILAEDSEPEVVVPVRKVGRPRKETQAGTEARRAAETNATEDVDSGWEDNNIFQSGAESSSPIRPSPTKPRTRRSTAAPRKSSRKSASVPPQFSPPASPTKQEARKPRSTRQSSVKPPESTFEPDLPPEATLENRLRSLRRKTGLVLDVVSPRKADKGVIEVPSDLEDVEPTKFQEVAAVSEDATAQAGPSNVVLEKIREASVEVIEETKGEEVAEEDLPHEELPDIQEESQENASQVEHDEYVEDEQTAAVAKRIAEGGQPVRRKNQKSQRTSNTLKFFLALITMATLTSVYNYKIESAPIGFCETGTKSNEVLETLRTRRAAILACNHENRTLLWTGLQPDGTQSAHVPTPTPSPGDSQESQLVDSEQCPMLPLLPIPVPDECAPCPANAICTPKAMTCETGYLLQPHPLLFFLSPAGSPNARDHAARNTYTLPAYEPLGSSIDKSVSHLAYAALSAALDGVPGLGPVAFAPRCVEDPKRKRHIGALGKAVEAMLAAERGRRLCAGVGWKQEPGTVAEEAKKWGVEVETLKDTLRRKTSPNMVHTFEDTWNEAIQQLLVWGGVFIGEDESELTSQSSGKRYLAHRTPQMDMACTVTVKARETWDEWRKQVFAFLTLLGTIVYVRHQRAQKAIENERVAVLAQSALNLLRSQELAHYTDPVTAPHAYLPSLQLRDLILQDEPSIRARRRLWAGVERVVEENTNIRTNLEEVEGGNEERVWRWVGSAGAGKSLVQGPADELEQEGEEEVDVTTI
ncbi:Man1-Src1p-C-terminal domain-containing protein [Irpex rosettiformis]|uniref:Man1-Src1p-C-terminal domain-containing protein n=1 Tax=Irpex rosettiformis TaxID=378272 RepID=A0ACB8UHU4_9APHY|nr:Man1-Src1p-C-terminal domain-containing protein [Irpex rosettiformis]